MHNGYWVPVNPLPDSIIVNIGDHMEVINIYLTLQIFFFYKKGNYNWEIADTNKRKV